MMIINVLFTEENISIEGMTNKDCASILSKAKMKLERINVYGTYLKIRKRDQSLNLVVIL